MSAFHKSYKDALPCPKTEQFLFTYFYLLFLFTVMERVLQKCVVSLLFVLLDFIKLYRHDKTKI